MAARDGRQRHGTDPVDPGGRRPGAGLTGVPTPPDAPGAGTAPATTPASAPAARLHCGPAVDRAALGDLVRGVAALPEGERPWCAGVVVVAGQGDRTLVREAFGWAVRYAGYDEDADRGVELPPPPGGLARAGTPPPPSGPPPTGGPASPSGRAPTTSGPAPTTSAATPAGAAQPDPPTARVPMRTDTVFDLASLTKLGTAVVAARQLERGTLALDRPVADYAPELTAAAAHGITVRQLLTHTSGLRPELPLYALPDDPGHAARWAALAAEPPLEAPGRAYRYSDLNLLLLQRVLERATGHPLDRLVRETITGPLGMDRTRFRPPAAWRPEIAATEDQRAPWGKLDRGLVHGVVHDENAYALGGVAGHAGLFAPAGDLEVLCRALLAGGCYRGARILAPESVDALLAPPGLGFAVDQRWFMGELAGRGAAGHTGFTGTSLVIDRASGGYLILLANTVHPRRRPADNAPRAAAATHLARAIGAAPMGARTH